MARVQETKGEPMTFVIGIGIVILLCCLVAVFDEED